MLRSDPLTRGAPLACPAPGSVRWALRSQSLLETHSAQLRDLRSMRGRRAAWAPRHLEVSETTQVHPEREAATMRRSSGTSGLPCTPRRVPHFSKLLLRHRRDDACAGKLRARRRLGVGMKTDHACGHTCVSSGTFTEVGPPQAGKRPGWNASRMASVLTLSHSTLSVGSAVNCTAAGLDMGHAWIHCMV